MTTHKRLDFDTDKIVDRIQKEMKLAKVVGFGCSFFSKDEVILEEGFGKRDLENNLPFTKETKFPIASCTKSFTATAVIALVSEGKLDLDKPIKEYIPEFQLYDDYTTNNTTTRDILSHTTGLPHHMLLYMNKEWDYTQIFDRLPYLKPLHKFRYMFHYCNLHYIIATNLVERVSGKKYTDYLTEKILSPLGMKDTTFSIKDFELADNITKGYVEDGGKIAPAKYLELAQIATGAGNLNSSLADLRKWVRLHLNKGKVGTTQLISQEAMSELYKIQKINHLNPYHRLSPDTNYVLDSGYALGWTVTSYRGSYVIRHMGAGGGMAASVGFLPFEEYGIVMFSNIFNNNLTIFFDLYFTDLIKNLDPVDWGGIIRRMEQQDIEKMKESKKNAPKEPKEPIQPATLAKEQYTGHFHHPGYGTLEIALEADLLNVTYGKGSKYVAKHISADIFEFTISDFQAKSKLEYVLDSNHKVTGIKIKGDSSLDPVVFLKEKD